MYDNSIMPGENIGESYPRAQGEVEPSTYVSEWETAMQDGVDEFQGEWGYGSSGGEFTLDDQSLDAQPNVVTKPAESFDQDLTPDQQMAGASRITSYGFDTACRIYGLGNILTTIYNTDLTDDEVVRDPMQKLYETIEPHPDNRVYLFNEIQKDLVVNNQHNDDPDLNTIDEPLGITPYGEFYDKHLYENTSEQTSLDAIKAMKQLLDSLATDERFQPLRERATRENKSIIDLLVGNTINPTITTFLNGVGGELSSGSVARVLDEIEQSETTKAAEEQLSEIEDEIPEETADAMETLADGEIPNLDNIPGQDLAGGNLTRLDEPGNADAAALDLDSNSNPDDVADGILNRFNQEVAKNNSINQLNNRSTESAPSNRTDDFLTDEEFAAILRDEPDRYHPSGNKPDTDAILQQLQSDPVNRPTE